MEEYRGKYQDFIYQESFGDDSNPEHKKYQTSVELSTLEMTSIGDLCSLFHEHTIQSYARSFPSLAFHQNCIHWLNLSSYRCARRGHSVDWSERCSSYIHCLGWRCVHKFYICCWMLQINCGVRVPLVHSPYTEDHLCCNYTLLWDESTARQDTSCGPRISGTGPSLSLGDCHELESYLWTVGY